MSQAENERKINQAFSKFIERKDRICLAALSEYMKQAVEYAMQLHEIIWPGDNKVHTYHSLKIKDDFGWAVVHNGMVMEVGMGAGTKIPGRYSELFSLLAQTSKTGWSGHIVSIVEPLKLNGGRVLYYKRDFEEFVFKEIHDLTVNNFKEVFTAKVLSMK